MEKILPKQKNYENVANTIIKNLSKRQIEGYYCKNKQEALQKALELIPKGASIRLGRFDDAYRNRINGSYTKRRL